ncbi:hypothetical protein [Streptomyces cucumeris]|uniref:hypothetical protein n=1 Tax=Streptomyces cucumeris TaxID=2962890 RepID=UPI003D75165C
MSNAVDETEGSRLQKAVETIVMTPAAAAKVVDGYRVTFEDKNERKPESLEDKRRIAAKIIGRYSKMSAAAGAATAAPSVVPGVGTAVAILGGGATDIAVALKLQVDMCMCLVEVFETELSTEDKKHLAFTMALAGSAEQMAAKGGKAAPVIAHPCARLVPGA